MNRRKKLLSLLLVLVMLFGLVPASVFAADMPYTDVSETDWFYDGVKYTYEHQLMSGTGDYEFSPGLNTTRGMLVTILYRIDGTPAAGTSTFSDVPIGEWYSDAVAWASSNEIVGGYSAESFGPTDDVTREQMATILYRYASYKGYDVSAQANINAYADASRISDWALQAVSWANAKELVNGVDNNLMDPQGAATRAQTAVVLTRFCENIVFTEQQSSEPEESAPAAKTFVVTFDLNYGDNGAYQRITVEDGKTVSTPESPTRSGYSFGGWYTTASSGSRFNFNTPITSDITLYASWNEVASVKDSYGYIPYIPYLPSPDDPDSGDNLNDEIIDLGDITELISQGTIEVIFDDNGDIRTIEGQFTNQKVETIQDASAVLNAASSLFGSGFHASPSEIAAQTVEGNADADDEHFFRYSPTVNGIPVLGSQIVLSTDENGNVTGLHSAYHDRILSVDTNAEITPAEAEDAAVGALMGSEPIQALISEYSSKLSRPADELEQELETALRQNASIPQLMVYAVDNNEAPALVYEVTLSDTSFSVYSVSDDTTPVHGVYSIGDDTTPIELGDPGDTPDDSDTEVMLSIHSTYYIYANGENVGEVCDVISNQLSWTTYSLSSPDLKGVRRTYIGQEENGVYRLYDPNRNIETRKATATSTGHLWWKETTYSLPGDIVTSSFNTFGVSFFDRSAVSAHANMEAVYDYYLNTLGRKSYDGSGAKITTTVGYYYDDAFFLENPGQYINACWTNGYGRLYQFVFGKGNFEAAVDVMGHEFTHAVISSVVDDSRGNSGLLYENESGALNESYADIMGSLVEGKSGSGRWLLGEDCDYTVRSMASPSSYRQPEHYSSRYTGTDDNGGVHTNSGIFNFAAYKMMTDSRTSRISSATWANVFYRSLYRLTTTATFLDARGAVIASAKALGFNAAEQQAIKDAFDAVGIQEPDSIRIVLRWGATPSDLDSHLVGPGVNGGRFHTAFYQRSYYTDGTYDSSYGQYVADLDYDDITSYGPEVTTIHTFTPGDYYFFVHDYSNGHSETSTAMANSGATVKVYSGASSIPLASFSVDTTSKGTYWNVFKLTVGADKSITIEAINTYGAGETLS